MRVSYFRPATPPQAPRISTKDITPAPPKEINEGEPASKIKTIGIPILIVAVLIAIVYFMVKSGRFSPYFLIFPLILLGTMGHLVFGQNKGTGTSRAEILDGRKAIMRGLGANRELAFKYGLSMHNGLQWSFPDPQTLPTRTGTSRMWEVLPTSDGYSALRYGVGEVEFAARVVAPVAPPGEFLEPVGWLATVKFLKHHSTASSMPVAITLTRFPVIGFTGDRDASLGMLRAMLMQAAHTHGPDNLAIVVLTDDPDGPQWSWTKWLPHTQHPFAVDRLGSQRMVYSDWSTLQESLGGDDTDPDDPSRVIDFEANFNPDVEITTDDYRHVLVVVDTAVRDKLVDSVIAPRGALTWLIVDPAADSITAEEGVTFRTDADGTVWRTDADRPGLDPVKVARADYVSLIDAATWARQLARHEVGTVGMVQGPQGPKVERGRDWQSLMRLHDISTWDPFETWSMIGQFSDRRRLRIPIGFLDNGDHLELDIKQAAEKGIGPHGLIIGTTGSGKSEFLRNMFINACVMHSPDLVNWLLVDFKGGATFLGVEDVPHVTAVITNMEDESHLVGRLREMIDGEISRRFKIFREAKDKHPRVDIQELRDYERLRERGADLPPLPALLVIIDEFAELLQAHPDYGDIFKRIGRVGRSVGIHLIYASQNMDNTGRTSGLETNQGYKIGLKTQTAAESRALLDGSDAAYKLPGTPGHGVLRTTAGELIRFYTGWTGAPYFPPETAALPAPATDRVQDVPAAASGSEVRAFTAATQPLPEGQKAPEPGPVERTEAELDAAPTLFTAVTERLREANFHEPYRMWLPPLSVLTLDQVDPMLATALQPSNSTPATMQVPLGLFDEPAEHAQPPWIVDASGNVLILGDGGMGKSTAVKTLVCSLALLNTPEQVQFYIIDFAGGGLGVLEGLPHVGAVVTKADPDGVNRILTQMEALLRDRERLFREHKIDIDEYRRLRTNPDNPFRDLDPYGDVYVIIDGWDAATSTDQVLQHRGGELEALVIGARNYGLHFVVSTSRIVEMRGSLAHLNTVIELHTSEMSQVGAQLAKARREEPGHAIAKGSELQALVALPRIDGQADMVGLTEGTAELVESVAARFRTRAARLKTLPTSLLQHELAALVTTADAAAAADPTQAALADKRRLRIAIGVREDTLGPAYAEMYREPHLLVIGDAKTGKSQAISTFCDSVARRFDGIEDAAIVLIDPRRSHLGRVDSKNLFAHIHRIDDIHPAMTELYERFNLGSRSVPPDVDAETRAARSWWSGPEIFIVVDDYHLATDIRSLDPNQPLYQMAPWLGDEPLARGYHFVIARSSSDLLLSATRDPLIKRLTQDRAPTVMLSADRYDGQIGEYKFERFGLPGRGRYVEAGLGRAGRVQLAWSGRADALAMDFED